LGTVFENEESMKTIREIGPSTQLCAIIGNPVSHSMSPAIHNRAFEALGLDFVYTAFRVENVGAALAGMRALENFRGLSVTIPHKTAVIEHLDHIEDVDAVIGSVNTVVNDGGRLRGFGSDGPGARKAIESNGVNLSDARVLMLGSGGAARAIAFDLAYLKNPPATIQLLGVIEEELTALANQLRANTKIDILADLVTERNLEKAMADAEVIIHATPVGMHPKEDQSVIPKSLFREGAAVMDIVYNPLQTKLLREAKESGLKTISGLDMFVNQAALQFESWTGKPAPVDLMREVVLENLG
jgi:shikimate dehydrogenase